MYVIVTYDVKGKRVKTALKICRKYLIHVQRSVFEGSLTERQLKCLERELERNLVSCEDSVCIYRMNSLKYVSKTEWGLSASNRFLL